MAATSDCPHPGDPGLAVDLDGLLVDHGRKHARGGLLWDLETTKVFTRGGRSAAYKFVVLVWAVAGADLLTGPIPLYKVRDELADLLVPFAVADSTPNPADPWVALRSSGWWALGLPDGVDEAMFDHQKFRSLVVRSDLAAGLNQAVRSKLQDSAWRDEAVAVLLCRIGELSTRAHAGQLADSLGIAVPRQP